VGAAAINRFGWVFYLFGAFLVYTAVQLVRGGSTLDSEYEENSLIRTARRLLPLSPGYDGARLVTRIDTRTMLTPMVIVFLAIGSTDLLFAVDSIPAIFGLTKDPFIVYTATIFALMGLRQLYFLLGGLLDRLTYLSHGLAVILGFIGVKLLFEALHINEVPFINGGRHVTWAPVIPVWMSLAVIVVTLAVTTAVSLLMSRRAPGAAAASRGGTSSGEDVGIDDAPNSDGVPGDPARNGRRDQLDGTVGARTRKG
jgi:tellurite resistance protein TerC